MTAQTGAEDGAGEAEAQAPADNPAATEIDETQYIIGDGEGAEETLPGGTGTQGEQNPADGGPEDAAPLQAPRVLGTGDYLRMIGVLAFVILLLYLFFLWMKKAGRGNLTDNDTIRLLGGRPMGGNTALHLVEVGNQIFLVGRSENSLNLISEITDQETRDQIRLQYEQEEGGPKQNFGRLLWNKVTGGKKLSLESPRGDGAGHGKKRSPMDNQLTGGSSLNNTADFIKKQRSRLKDFDQ